MDCSTSPFMYNGALVHLNVGGVIYTTDEETLNRFPESKLAQLTHRSQPILIDSVRNGYFINRDGKMFRHILNFLRTKKLLLPKNFLEMDLLLEEATFYGIKDLCKILMKQLDQTSGFERHPVPNKDKSTIPEGGSNEHKKRQSFKKNRNIPSQKKVDEHVCNDGVEKVPIIKPEVHEMGGNTNLDCDVICITALTNGSVDEVWSSSDLIEIANFPETLIVKKLRASKCYESGDFLFSTSLYFSGYTKCSKCSEHSKLKYIWNGDDIGCELCVKNTENEMYSQEIKKLTVESRVSVGFPWLAKYFMKMGFKLVSTCASQTNCLLYHYFVKEPTKPIA